MNTTLIVPTVSRLLTEVVRLRFKDQYARHRQMNVQQADEEVRLKLEDIRQLVEPLLGPEQTEKTIQEALQEARIYRTE